MLSYIEIYNIYVYITSSTAKCAHRMVLKIYNYLLNILFFFNQIH